MYAEAGDVRTANIKPFWIKLDKLIENEHFSYSYRYNADEMGFIWYSMPNSIN